MRYVWGGESNPGDNLIMGEWCARQLWPDGDERFENYTTLGIMNDTDLLGVVVFHNWSPRSGTIELSAASISPRWLTRQTLLNMYGYPFDECGCQMVFQRNSVKNTRISGILRRFGHDEILLPRMRGRNEDELLFTLTEEKWREKEKELNRG